MALSEQFKQSLTWDQGAELSAFVCERIQRMIRGVRGGRPENSGANFVWEFPYNKDYMASDPLQRWAPSVALLPVVSVFSILSLTSLPRWRTLPASWQWVLGLFTLTQLIAASLTPEPLLSLLLAGGRVLLTVGLILTGMRLGSSRALRPALIGYVVVAVTAFVTTSVLHSTELFTVRLQHPYLTPVSLGLAGTLGILLAVTWKGGPVIWRLLAGGLSLGMFLWSGSRGPLIALGAGLLAALIVSQGRQIRGVLLTILGAAALILSIQHSPPNTIGNITTRFFSSSLNGRSSYWADALDTASTHLLGGVGPYQLGPYLSTQFGSQSCNLWLGNDAYNLTECPFILNELRGSWLIAHNTLFHLLGETGVVGTAGSLMLMGTLATAAWRSRSPLLCAVTWAITSIGLVDNPTLLPNLGHAELFWLVGGVAIALTTPQAHVPSMVKGMNSKNLARGKQKFRFDYVFFSKINESQWIGAWLLSMIMLIYFSFPVWISLIQPKEVRLLPIVDSLTMPNRIVFGQFIAVAIRINLPKGSLHGDISSVAEQVQVNICPLIINTSEKVPPSCTPITRINLEAGIHWSRFTIFTPDPGDYQLVLKYIPDENSLVVSHVINLASSDFRVVLP